ncbi:MAG: terminase large subunit domain-containing protein [Ferrimicrobium sp.]
MHADLAVPPSALPLLESPLDTAWNTDGDLVVAFAEAVCRVTKGPEAGQLVRVRPWQRHIIEQLYRVRPDGKRAIRSALIGLPRKNGKSLLGSLLALWALVADDEVGAEVYSAAGDKDQAKIVFADAKRMVELDRDLSQLVMVYRDALEVKSTGSIYRALSADAPKKEGLNPSMVVFDEVHVQPNDELWNVLSQGSGTRPHPLVVGITTAGVLTDSHGRDTLCYGLYQRGARLASGELVDSYDYFCWYGAKADANWLSPRTWADANPALGDYLHLEDLEATSRRIPESDFRTKRLNQWVLSRQSFLPTGAWAKCVDMERHPEPDERVVLAFDGSWTHDSTALVLCTVPTDEHPKPHLEVLGLWEEPLDDPHWRVPAEEVLDTIRDAVETWRPLEVACDVSLWQRELQDLEDEGVPVIEFPNSISRMVPATTLFYQLVTTEGLTHSGDPRLQRHVDNTVLRTDARGSRMTKERSTSGRHIDAAIASAMALSRATALRNYEPPSTSVFVYDLAEYL